MEYKRKQRALSDATKQKISTKLKGRRKSLSHCQISVRDLNDIGRKSNHKKWIVLPKMGCSKRNALTVVVGALIQVGNRGEIYSYLSMENVGCNPKCL